MGEEVAVSLNGEDARVAEFYPMYFGVSCAFVALRLLSKAKGPDVDGIRWFRIGEGMLQGSAQLLGLLVWRAQREESMERVKRLEMENMELKRLRTEDAKANEKVVNIYSTQEQCWIAEKKRLRLQIQALFSQFRMIETKKEEVISNLNGILKEKEGVIQGKDEELEEEKKKRMELEEKLRMVEVATMELTERLNKEADDHAAELLKHKTAFMELVSNQRQLEAEISRAQRQAEEAKREVEEVFEQKEEAAAAAERFEEEMGRMRKDGEQKDKILSAMLRKSKLNTVEKQMLMKEVKISKARKKQAELEVERWRAMCEPRRRKGSRGVHAVEAAGCSSERRLESHFERTGFQTRTLLLEYLEAESRKERECVAEDDGDAVAAGDCFSQFSGKDSDELVMIDIRQLQDWVRSETEKYVTVLEQRHYAEIEAFTEQMRLKDEKLEAFRWQLLSAELESKRLRSHIDGLDGNLSQVREENIKLEALLLDKEKELKSIKDRFTLHVLNCRKNSNFWTSSGFLDPQALWSEVKIINKSKEREQEKHTNLVLELYLEEQVQEGSSEAIHELKHKNLESESEQVADFTDITTACSTVLPVPINRIEGHEQSARQSEEKEIPYQDLQEDMVLSDRACEDEGIDAEKEVSVDPGHVHPKSGNAREVPGIVNKFSVSGHCHLRKDSPWKMDLQALGVSYKIKRLKQQLVVLEKLAGKDSNKRKGDEKRQPVRGFLVLVSLLNKQAKRYQSLEDKTDDLCRRMNESGQGERSGRDSSSGRTKEESETLEQFLEETFQLQRYMVATGQKLMEIQSRITCSFINGDERHIESAGFNMGQFSDIVRCLLREIQRGLEVRIARMIGKIEGTLARDGIMQMRI